MAEKQPEGVTKAQLETSSLSAIVHDVDFRTNENDLERLIRRHIGQLKLHITFGEPRDVHGKQQKKAFLNFKNKEAVDQLMKIRSLTYNGQEMKVSRYLPKICPMSGRITSTVLLTIDETNEENGFKKKLTEYDIEKYFEKFGKISDRYWRTSDQFVLQYQSYDSVDQIILYDVSHTINGIKVFAEKFPTKEQTNGSTSDTLPYCIHVKNMPLDVTSDELSAFFSVHVADILLQPGDPLSSHLVANDYPMTDAWIKHLSDQRSAEAFAKKYDKMKLRGFEIHCKVVQELPSISELCREMEKGVCKYSSNQCNYKHIMCSEPNECKNTNCWYGHSDKRSVKSDKRPAENSEKAAYRVKISNLSWTITEKELLKRLDFPLKYIGRVKFPDQPPVAKQTMVAYIVDQPSENLLRQKIRNWHDSSFSKEIPNKMKCQLERNMSYFDWDEHSNLSKESCRNQTLSSTSTITKRAPWCNDNKSTSSALLQTENSNDTNLKLTETNSTPKSRRKKTNKAQDQEPSDLATLAPQWCWTGEKLSTGSMNTADVYLLVDKKNNKQNAVIKIYRIELNQIAQHERIVLEKLNGLEGIPKLLASNIHIQSTNDPWIIMEYIHGITLFDFIKTNPNDFRDKIMLIIKLLNIIREMHSRKVVHRQIDPNNIMIRTPLDTQNSHDSDQNNLVLIGFSRACLNEDMIFTDDCNQIPSTFYQVPQLERQSSTDNDNKSQQDKNLQRNPTIDTSSICAVLFWLITNCYPKESRNIHGEAPHQLKNHMNIINEEAMKATKIWTETEKLKHIPIKQHIQLIFDRGFGQPDQQWPINELAYQLQHILQLVTSKKGENSCFLSPVAKKQADSSPMATQPNSFLQLASFLDLMKQQFSIRYPDISWSTDNKSGWRGDNQHVTNKDYLIFRKQHRSIEIETICSIQINKSQELFMKIIATVNQNNIVTLPLGVWKHYDQENIKEEISKVFELELKILVDIFFNKMIT